jgi:hypothetical protein
MDNNNNNEKIMLKITIEQINENINNKFNMLKEEMKYLEDRIKSMLKENYICKQSCKDNQNEIKKNNNIQLEKEEISYKKIVLITTSISSIISTILSFLSHKL